MTREQLVLDVVKRLNAHIDYLGMLEIPGSVHVEIHCDTTGPRKAHITCEESWGQLTEPKTQKH